MKPKLIIIGSGLGGCFLADRLLGYYDITMIDLPDEIKLKDKVFDISSPSNLYPILDSGFGGSTKVWHNALMDIDDLIFHKKWPFDKNQLQDYYNDAYKHLTGNSKSYFDSEFKILKKKFIKLGFPHSFLNQYMFIPKKRINAWNFLKLDKKVTSIKGEIVDFEIFNSKIQTINIKSNINELLRLKADYFVLSSGGLGTPLLIQKLLSRSNSKSLKNSGYNYEDHPLVFVGNIKLKKSIYKLWNYPLKSKNYSGNLRIPLSFYYKNLQISFQLRPSYHLLIKKPKKKILTLLSDIRNFPFNIKNYLKLILSLDDFFEFLSLKFGFNVPTNEYSILLIAEQPSSKVCSVYKKNNKIFRDWRLDSKYLNDLDSAINFFLTKLSPITISYYLFNDWKSNIASSSHHSGTAKISNNKNNGVCDKNGKVFDFKNLYICDGSLIPSSGFVNTGLTIVALSKKIGDNFKKLLDK